MGIITGAELGRLQFLVDSLGYDLEPSILIGGWATQLRVGGEVSKDIDLIINDLSLRTKLREVLGDYTENGHHSGGRKGRGTINGGEATAANPDDMAERIEAIFELVPDRAQLNKAERRRFASMRREWLEEAGRQRSAASGTPQTPTIPVFGGRHGTPRGSSERGI